MSHTRLIICAGLALTFGGATLTPGIATAQPKPAQQHSAAETALLDAESKRFDAQVAADVKTLGMAVADEAIYIHATGQMQTKAEYLSDVEAGKSKYRSIEATDRTATIRGDIGIIHGSITLNVGVDRHIDARYTGVYVKRDNRWQVLSFQTTPITQRQ